MLLNTKRSLSRFFVMLYCGILFGWNCFKVVCRALVGKEKRHITNGYLHNTAKKMFKSIHANYSITYTNDFKYLDSLPRIYMSNHLSLFDTPLFYATINDTIRIVTKKELTRLPIIGKAIISSEHAIVDRKSKDHQNFFDDAKKKLHDGIALWFFPEGTRSRTGELLPFKSGGFRLAREAGAQIIPVGILGTNHVLPAGKLKPFHHKTVEIRLGAPIDARAFQSELQQQALLELVRGKIIELCTPH